MKLSKKQIWQIVGACVLCAILVFGLIIGMYFSLDSMNKLTNNPTASVEEGSPLAIDCESTSDIMLTSSVATTASDGTTSQVLIATVEPSTVTGLTYNWTVAWKDENSAWATGKKVTDYVLVAPSPESNLKAFVTCLQAFGEQVIVTISCANFDVSASATVDYVKRLNGYSVGLSYQDGNTVITFDDTLTGEAYARSQSDVVWGTDSLETSRLDDLYSFTNLSYTAGTITGDSYLTITFADGVEHRISGSLVFDPQSVDVDYGYTGKICSTSTVIALYYNNEKVADWQFSISEIPTSLSLDKTSLVF